MTSSCPQWTCSTPNNTGHWNTIYVHISVPMWCIVGYGTDAMWDLWSWSVHWSRYIDMEIKSKTGARPKINVTDMQFSQSSKWPRLWPLCIEFRWSNTKSIFIFHVIRLYHFMSVVWNFSSCENEAGSARCDINNKEGYAVDYIVSRSNLISMIYIIFGILCDETTHNKIQTSAFYTMILHISMRWLGQKLNQTSNLQKAPHISP